MEALRVRFGSVCDFIKVYVSEAHTVDEWKIYSDIDYCQPATLAARLEAATRLLKENPFIGAKLYLDDMDNAAERAFAAHPERLFVVSGEGQVLFKGGKGPFGYEPTALEAWLENFVEKAT